MPLGGIVGVESFGPHGFTFFIVHTRLRRCAGDHGSRPRALEADGGLMGARQSY